MRGSMGRKLALTKKRPRKKISHCPGQHHEWLLLHLIRAGNFSLDLSVVEKQERKILPEKPGMVGAVLWGGMRGTLNSFSAQTIP